MADEAGEAGERAPQHSARDGRASRPERDRAGPGSACTATKAIEITPIARRTASSLTRAASSQPTATPIIEEGIRMMRFRGEKSRRNAQTLTQSCTMRIGSTIAAALTGEATSDSIGIAERAQGPKSRPLTGRAGSPPGSRRGRIAFRPTFILFLRAPALTVIESGSC